MVNQDQYHYFAEDGNYGDATRMIELETSQFTEEDWQAIECATDDDRASLAHAISSKYHPTVFFGLPQESIDRLKQLLVEYEVE